MTGISAAEVDVDVDVVDDDVVLAGTAVDDEDAMPVDALELVVLAAVFELVFDVTALAVAESAVACAAVLVALPPPPPPPQAHRESVAAVSAANRKIESRIDNGVHRSAIHDST